MPSQESRQPHYPTVELVLNAIADWVSRYRDSIGHSAEFGQCDAREVSLIAKDLGVSEDELRDLATKGPHSADLLQKMLVALDVDPQAIVRKDPLVMRDLQRLCAKCADKARCGREFEKGTAAANFHEFCPNAFTLDALFEEQHPGAKH